MTHDKAGDQDNVIVQKFIDLSSLLTKAQSEKMAKQAQYQQLKEQGPNASLIVNNPLIGALRQQMVVEQAKVSAMGKIYLPGHPEMQAETAKLAELKSRLDAEVRRVQDSVKADYEAAERTENLLKNSFENQKQQMVNLQDNLSNYQILKRDAQTNEQLYQALLARVKEVNISSTMVSSNVSVIDPAPLPSSPFSPKKFQNMALATLLGLVLGVVLALLVESLDDTIKSTEDLEKNCNLPLLGTLPSLNSYHKFTLGRRKKWESLRAGDFCRAVPTCTTRKDLMRGIWIWWSISIPRIPSPKPCATWKPPSCCLFRVGPLLSSWLPARILPKGRPWLPLIWLSLWRCMTAPRSSLTVT